MSGSDSGAIRIAASLTNAARLGNSALINGTATIVSLAAPNDGNFHNYWISAVLKVTVNETGGQVTVSFTQSGTVVTSTLFLPNNVVGNYTAIAGVMADPGTTVLVQQATALTAGNATVSVIVSGG